MFARRLFHASSFRPPRTSRLPRGSIALAVGVSGAYLLYNAKTLHAEADLNLNTNSPTIREQSFGKLSSDSRFDYLKQAAASYFLSEDPAIIRYDTVVVPSNSPTEDYIASAFIHLDHSHTWSIFSIFDGHNGPLTSAWLADNLIPAIVGGLADLFSSQPPRENESEHVPLDPSYIPPPTPPPPAEIDQALKDAFNRVDDDIVNWAAERALASPSKEAAVNLLLPAYSGSCALVAYVDSESRKLRVALTGDSRAILGRRVTDATGKATYEVHILSVDQNAYNPAEEERMNKEHPGETIMVNGRVLGWGMSRAFGDAAYKWSLDIQRRLNEEYLGDRIRSNVKTPPYFTAEPVVTTTDIQPGDFLVLGSDGLWDCLTNEEVVGLVAIWKDTHDLHAYKNAAPSEVSSTYHHMATSDFAVNGLEAPYEQVIARNDLPVTLEEDKTVMYPWWKSEKKFVNVDDNVACHLARNALGGADKDLAAALLSTPPPKSRRLRDDLSALVVFFREDSS
ncbi:hypothetical protein ONZ45_g3796 [Pleurotus djamor]|nr:hypothetical protein ONZ45_g3796 [Pleurotus djamor]